MTEAASTRHRIIERALEVAATDGLDGITIGRLAGDLRMSKAGVIGHFGTKETMQLETLRSAVERFRERVPARVVGAKPGVQRLSHAYREWVDYMGPAEGHGGCLLTSVASEFDGRPGPVRDAVLAALSQWADYVTEELHTAVRAGELPADTDVGQVLFELNGVALAAHQAIELHRDPMAPGRASNAIGRLLGT